MSTVAANPWCRKWLVAVELCFYRCTRTDIDETKIAAGIGGVDAVSSRRTSTPPIPTLRAVKSGGIVITENMTLDHAVVVRQQKSGTEKSVLDRMLNSGCVAHSIIGGLHHEADPTMSFVDFKRCE